MTRDILKYLDEFGAILRNLQKSILRIPAKFWRTLLSPEGLKGSLKDPEESRGVLGHPGDV